MQNLETFKTLVRKCLTRAGEQYGLEEQMKNVKIRLDIRGYRCAGQAVRKGFQFSVRFHPDAIMKHWDDMVNNTIPHEVAHTVCQMNPTLGKNHDAGWKRVCRRLGGDDSRTHDMKFGEKPNRKQCWYRTSTGFLTELGPIRHSKLQSGGRLASYRMRGQGTITASGFVGHTKPGESQPLPEMEMAASTSIPEQLTTQAPAKNGSKAAIAREYIQRKLLTSSKYEMQLLTPGHTDEIFKLCGFGTRGAARSCFLANLEKLA
jgi:SprT protein